MISKKRFKWSFALGFVVVLCLASVVKGDCTTTFPQYIDDIIPPWDVPLIENDPDSLITNGKYLMRLIRIPEDSIPFNITHLFISAACAQAHPNVTLIVVSQKAVPSPTREWKNCPDATYVGEGQFTSSQEVTTCLPESFPDEQMYVVIELPTPISVFEHQVYVGFTVKEQGYSVAVSYLDSSEVLDETQCWPYYIESRRARTFHGARVSFAVYGEPVCCCAVIVDDPIPGWTCNYSLYGDGYCNCNCGILDVDCIPSHFSEDCEENEICYDGKCKLFDWVLLPLAYDDYACYPGYYDDNDYYCDIGCGNGFDSIDPNCLFPDYPLYIPGIQRTCDRATNLCFADNWTCNYTEYDDGQLCKCGSCGIEDPSCNDQFLNTTCPDNMVCVDNKCDHPRNWTCGDKTYNSSGDCDCECGAYDPDCLISPVVTGCQDGQSCAPNGTCIDAVCGNGIVDLITGEECDGGEGCDPETCKCIDFYTYYYPKRPDCHPFCGDGHVVGDEECDSSPGCLDTCVCAPGLTALNGSCFGCGNKLLESGEECDGVDNCDNSTCRCLATYEAVSGNMCKKTLNMTLIISVAAAGAFVIVLIIVIIIVVKKLKKKGKKSKVKKGDDSDKVLVPLDDIIPEPEMKVDFTALDNITPASFVGVPASHLDQWGVEPTIVDFLSGGAPVPVCIMMEQAFVIKNLSLTNFTFSVTVPTSNKFLVVPTPATGNIDPGHTLTFKMSGVIYCSKDISGFPVYLSVSFTDAAGAKVEEYISLDLVIKGQPSNHIDYDDLVLDEVIGEGSFGTVYKGTYLSKPAAIKSLKDLDHDALNEFLHEVETLGKLQNPYIASFFGAVITHNKTCLVTEYMALGSLGDVLKKYSLSERLKIRITLDAVKGLEYLHQMNVMHCNIKPSNILCSSLDLSAPVLCKISDFGVSHTETGKKSKQKSKDLDSVLYMAPEVFSGSASYSKAADVFSFGVLMSQIWNEAPPYCDREFDTTIALTSYVSSGGRPSVMEGCPATYLKLMQQCWDAEPEGRPNFAECASFLAQVNDVYVLQGNALGTKHVVEKRYVK